MSWRITIPEPCHEDWNTMTPVEKGRHCAACCKTVIDFTSWTLEHIAAYLKNHSSSAVCGRFQNSQLNVEIPCTNEQWVQQVAATGISLLQKVALIFLLAFGIITTSCSPDSQLAKNYQTTGLLLTPRGYSDTVQTASAGSFQVAVDASEEGQQQKVVRKKEGMRKHVTVVQEPMAIQVDVQVTAGAPIMEELPPQVRDTLNKP